MLYSDSRYNHDEFVTILCTVNYIELYYIILLICRCYPQTKKQCMHLCVYMNYNNFR